MGFNIGTDQSITITPDAGGAPLKLDGPRSMFEMKAADTLLKSEPIDNGGIPDHRVVVDGYSGQIEVEKNNDSFGAFVSFADANFYDGADQQYFTITETIRKRDGSGGTERVQYIGCVFHGYEPGSWQKKQITKGRVQVAAAQRIAL